MDVTAVCGFTPHSCNTIVGLSLLSLSLIFKGQQCSKKNEKTTAKLSCKSERLNEQSTKSKEKIYRNLPISLGDSASVVGT